MITIRDEGHFTLLIVYKDQIQVQDDCAEFISGAKSPKQEIFTQSNILKYIKTAFLAKDFILIAQKYRLIVFLYSFEVDQL